MRRIKNIPHKAFHVEISRIKAFTYKALTGTTDKSNLNIQSFSNICIKGYPGSQIIAKDIENDEIGRASCRERV